MESRGKIKITAHARQRLSERLPDIPPDNYRQFISAARYKGHSINVLKSRFPEFAFDINRKYRRDNTMSVRLYKDCIFVFRGDNGKARTLVTVYELPNKYKVA